MSDTSARGEEAGGLSEHSFGRAVSVDLFPGASKDGNGPLQPLTREEFVSLQSVKAQDSGGVIEAYQLYKPEPYVEGLLYLPEAGNSSGRQFYTPRSENDNVFGGVFDVRGNAFFAKEPGNEGAGIDAACEWVWTLPSQGGESQPTLVHIGRPNELGFGYAIDAPDYLPVAGNQIVLRYEVTGGEYSEGQYSDLTWRALVNGNVVSEGTYGGFQYSFELKAPIMKSLSSGQHLVSQTFQVNRGLAGINASDWDGTPRTWSYVQRALTFKEPLPEYAASSEPVAIRNELVWDDGSPLEGTEVEWSVRGELVESGFVVNKTGETAAIQADWEPGTRVLAQTEDEDFEEIPFRISASAKVYTEGQPAGHPSLNYTISSDFGLPGARAFRVINERITTENPFEEPGVPVEVKADVVAIGLDVVEEDIEWTVKIKDPDGQEVRTLTEEPGYGPQVVAEWDGTVDGELVEDPQTYSFYIEAKGCEDDGGVVISERAADGVRGQELLCLTADATLAIGLTFQISDIRFGTNEDFTRDENGPYLVYDYINDEAPNDQPQWQKEGNEVVPVVVKQGTPLFAEIDFQATGRAVNVEAIRARVIFPGGRTDVVEATDIEELTFSGLGLAGSAKLRIPALPNEIGRHRMWIEWEAEIGTGPLGTETVEDTTPTKGAEGESEPQIRHMVYTVLGDQPEQTQNTGLGMIWYNSSSFKEEVPDSQPSLAGEPTRSPLDLAVYWASKGPVQGGSSDPETQIVERLATELADNGNWFYNFSSSHTLLDEDGLPQALQLAALLSSDQIECPDASQMIKLMSNYLGIDVSLRRFEFKDSSFGGTFLDARVSTNYLQIAGDRNSKKFRSGAGVYPPPSKTKGKPLELSGVSDFIVKIPSLQENGVYGFSIAPIPRHPSDWFQISWDYHQVARVESTGQVVDSLVRFSQADQMIGLNQNLFMNQHNMNDLYSFSSGYSRISQKFPDTLENYCRAYFDGWRQGNLTENLWDLPPVLFNSSENANAQGLTANAGNFAYLESQYLDKLLYLSGNKVARIITGFNEYPLPNDVISRATIMKVEIVNQ